MSERPDLDRTLDEAAPDPLDAGLAAAFGPDSGPPLPAAGSVVHALGAEPVQLRPTKTHPDDPVVRPGSDAVPTETPPCLQIHGEIARGGMGAVLQGRDTGLGRDVAVKVLLETHHGRTELVQRFVEEAQIAGQLQHPGVVPVYRAGPAGRPPSLLHHEAGQGPDPGRRPGGAEGSGGGPAAAAGHLPSGVSDVGLCPRRGVIHRDLKPSNVMVGAFGEVQVMDWGLAKVLSRDREGADEPEASVRQAVSVIQTPRSEPAGRRIADAGRQRAGDAGVHGPRAGPRRHRPGGRTRRRVRPGRHPVRNPHRPAAVHRPHGGGHAQGGDGAARRYPGPGWTAAVRTRSWPTWRGGAWRRSRGTGRGTPAWWRRR